MFLYFFYLCSINISEIRHSPDDITGRLGTFAVVLSVSNCVYEEFFHASTSRDVIGIVDI